MINGLRALSIAIAFLTVLPMPVVVAASPRENGRSLVAFPLAGLLLGSLLALLWLLVQSWPPLLAASIVLATWIGLTGALHLDGLADSADAWLGAVGDRERSLAIMRDPHCGAAAIVAVATVLLIKFSALVTIVSHAAWAILVFAPWLARAALVALFLTTPYVRPRGIMQEKLQHTPRALALVSAAVAPCVAVAWCGQTGLALVVATILVAWVLRWAMRRRLGGTTGDTAGALVELVETSALVLAGVLLHAD